ncbi:MAG TPA: DUF192 domain-containing protein [Euryarchaeota archaeon]|nr:DUF192 domain-containing protein [Euryarchaeota archaeon]HIQ09920.1 DUF192 domain-containing protein [Euryarchaeota archaeon]
MLVNRTKGRVITPKVDVADSLLRRGIGLMFRKSYDGALVFPKTGNATFHGFFCFFPILLLCLDENNRVIDKKILKPWRTVKVGCATVVELDARKKWEVNIGDELSWDAGRV